MMNVITYSPIGLIHSPHKEISGTPIQPPAATGVVGRVEVFDEYADGLADIEGFSHLILLYHFHLTRGPRLVVEPFLDKRPHGVFATRAPTPPNPVGLSIVILKERQGNILVVSGIDVVDGTPLLDIKPHVPRFVPDGPFAIGWLEDTVQEVSGKRADERFED